MTDYIRRDYALHNIECGPWDTETDRNRAIHYVRELTPAADVRPVVRARWEDETGYIFAGLAQRVYCPACKSYAYFYPRKTKNFCPTCGADMRDPNLDTTKGDNHD